jgi:hypothetical protein
MDYRGNRIVALPALACETGPGDPKAPAEAKPGGPAAPPAGDAGLPGLFAAE